MRNNLFKNAVELFKAGHLDWVEDDFFVVLLSKDYIPDFINHTTLADVPKEAIIAPPEPMKAKKIIDGKTTADDVFFCNVSGDKLIEAILIYTTPEDASSPLLIGHISNAMGMPIAPNGGDIFIKWQIGGNRIFSADWDGYTYD